MGKRNTDVEENEDEGDAGNNIILIVNADWRLVFDSLQFRVQHRKVRKTSGAERWITKGYCRYLDEAILFLAKNRIFMVPGVYELEDSLEMLGDALDTIKKELFDVVEKALENRDLPLTRRRRKTTATPAGGVSEAVVQ